VIEIRDTVAQAEARRRQRIEARRAGRLQERLRAKRHRKKVPPWRRDREHRAYLDFVRNLHCAVCGRPSTDDARNQAHHEPPKGLGGGGDWHDELTLPLCDSCHTLGPLARHGGRFATLEEWERAVGISAAECIARLNAAFGVLPR
jgi:hypothetical protein